MEPPSLFDKKWEKDSFSNFEVRTLLQASERETMKRHTSHTGQWTVWHDQEMAFSSRCYTRYTVTWPGLMRTGWSRKSEEKSRARMSFFSLQKKGCRPHTPRESLFCHSWDFLSTHRVSLSSLLDPIMASGLATDQRSRSLFLTYFFSPVRKRLDWCRVRFWRETKREQMSQTRERITIPSVAKNTQKESRLHLEMKSLIQDNDNETVRASRTPVPSHPPKWPSSWHLDICCCFSSSFFPGDKWHCTLMLQVFFAWMWGREREFNLRLCPPPHLSYRLCLSELTTEEKERKRHERD